MKKIFTQDLINKIPLVKGERILLSGTIYTARDAAHKRIFELIENKMPFPFPIQNTVIYYTGPTPTPPGMIIGSCGPTTSGRMDEYTPLLYNMGLIATIGKGGRSRKVTESMIKNNAYYLTAAGGAGALYAKCVTKCEEIAFCDLGCESIKKLIVEDMPLTME